MPDRHTKHGKWSEPSIPHKGWSCVDDDDLGEPSQLCEMCESAEIRYVHYMKHPNYPKILGVGCVCAEHMEQDYAGPKLREKRMRTRTRRRKTWMEREWRPSAKGNIYLNTEGFNLTIFETSGRNRWKLNVTNRKTGNFQKGTKEFLSSDEAQEAALKALLWAKDHLQ